MNERIENTYTRSGRIANPTEQVVQFIKKCLKIDVFQMSSQKKNGLFKNLPTYFRPFPTFDEMP